MTPDHTGGPRLTRRQALVAGGSAIGVAALGGYGISRLTSSSSAAADITRRARVAEIELGRRRVRTWTYDGQVPGPEVRIKAGDPVRIRIVNDLPRETTVHWHGIRVPNAADGVPGLTQRAIAAGDEFIYAFDAPDPGTYFFHPHVGVQLDRGLYAPLIVEPRQEPLAYDREAVLVLDDWLDGIDGTPDSKLTELRGSGMQMGGGMNMGGGGGGMDGGEASDPKSGGDGMSMGGESGGGMEMGDGGRLRRARHTALDGGRPGAASLAALANGLESGRLDPGDVRHPLYLINGRPPEDAQTIATRRGDRVRLRLVNASSDTIFCFFVEDHPLVVTHADGGEVDPVESDAVLIGMGERYDVLVESRAGGAPRIIAAPLGKPGRAVARLRYAGARAGSGRDVEAPFAMPPRIVSYEDLRGGPGRPAADARTLRLDLGLRRGEYVWTIGGQAFPNADMVEVRRDETVRFAMRNRTMMPHPMHLHGHFFRQLVGDRLAPRKDTVLVPPMRETTVEWKADNPGNWAFHCHNVYHQEAGMMRHVRVA